MQNKMKKNRVFWGIGLDTAVREQLIIATEAIKKSLQHASIKWLLPENFHLTLRFIGEATPELISQCLALVKLRLKDAKVFEIVLNEIQWFPRQRPHVIACMVSLNEELARLYHFLEEICQLCGLEAESRPYVPHITLARIKTAQHIYSNELIKNIATVQPVSEIILYKSKQHDGASYYRPLERISLS